MKLTHFRFGSSNKHFAKGCHLSVRPYFAKLMKKKNYLVHAHMLDFHH
jgi:hypothetical protein